MNRRTAKRVVLIAVPVLVLAVAARWQLSRPGSDNEFSIPSGAIEEDHNESAVAGSTLPAPSEVELREGSPPAVSAAGEADRAGDRVPAPPAASDGADVAASTNDAGPSLRFEEIDPLLRDANLIVRRTDSTGTQPALVELETLFSSEGRDPSWSASTESRILSEVAQVANLAVTSHEVECRETICRLKLFYPPSTDTLSFAGRFEPLADVLGFGDPTEVVTVGEIGVPMSLVYFQRNED